MSGSGRTVLKASAERPWTRRAPPKKAAETNIEAESPRTLFVPLKPFFTGGFQIEYRQSSFDLE